MSFCTFAEGAALFDATPIENMFLMEYMADAPAPALKLYLYARMLALHPELGGSLPEIASVLRMNEEEVYRSFTYWENRGLVRRLTDQPPTYAILPVLGSNQPTVNPLETEMRGNREFNNRLSELFDGQFIGEHEILKVADWQNILRFDQDAILRMVEYGIEQSPVWKSSLKKGEVPPRKPKPPSVFKRVDKLAEEWSQRGLRTLADVERVIAEENWGTVAGEVLKKLGISRQPSEPELAMVRQWMESWGYDQEAILKACDTTTGARNPSMKWLDTVLKNQLDENQKYRGDVAAVLKELNPRSAWPTPDQITRYAALIAQGFQPETILLAAVQCHRLNKERFDALEWRLDKWRKEGISTPEEAKAYMQLMGILKKELWEVLRKAESEREPGYEQIEKYRGWKEAYPAELIEYAAECARGRRDPVYEMDKLLTQWQKSGATTVEQARAQQEQRRQSGKTSGEKTMNPALNYAQREYKEEDFGDDFFIN